MNEPKKRCSLLLLWVVLPFLALSANEYKDAEWKGEKEVSMNNPCAEVLNRQLGIPPDSIRSYPRYKKQKDIAEFRAFVMKNLSYPKDVPKGTVLGVEVVSFIVTKEGRVKDIEMLRTHHPSCAKQLMHFVKSTDKKWTPACDIDGNPVAVRINIPADFGAKR